VISSRLAARIRRPRPRHEPSIEEIEERGLLLAPQRGYVLIIAAVLAVPIVAIALVVRFVLL
jgi:hypothetical protein